MTLILTDDAMTAYRQLFILTQKGEDLGGKLGTGFRLVQTIEDSTSPVLDRQEIYIRVSVTPAGELLIDLDLFCEEPDEVDHITARYVVDAAHELRSVQFCNRPDASKESFHQEAHVRLDRAIAKARAASPQLMAPFSTNPFHNDGGDGSPTVFIDLVIGIFKLHTQQVAVSR
jgi:hypothetical protein